MAPPMSSERAETKPDYIEGTLIVPQEARPAIVASRFNAFIVERLVEGALDCLKRHGADLSR